MERKIDYKLSYEDSKRLIESQMKIDESLKDAVLCGYVKTIKDLTHNVNKTLYDFAEQNNISLYNLCFESVPRVEPVSRIVENPFVGCPMRETLEYKIVLDPLHVSLDEDDSVWKKKYMELKERIKELVDGEQDV